jgi:hypothetical protein
MSTRCRIFVYGGQESAFPFSANLYRHSDGYPSSNLASIAAAASVSGGDPKKLAQALLLAGDGVRLEIPRGFVLREAGVDTDALALNVQEISAISRADESRPPESASCAWIGGWVPGMERNIRVAQSASKDLDGLADPWRKPSESELADLPLGGRLGLKLLGSQGDLEWVYFVDADRKNINVYTGYNVPSALVASGGRDPMLQVLTVMPQYAEGEARMVADSMAMVEKAGWTLNEAALGIEEDCARDARSWTEIEAINRQIPRGLPMAWPSDMPESRFDGPMIHVGEFWALQKTAKGSAHAFVVHERAAIGTGELAEGKSYSVTYSNEAKTQATALPLVNSRSKSADRSAGLVQ